MSRRIDAAELARLSALYRCGVLDSPVDVAFDAITQAVATTLQVQLAQLVFADARRLWAKSTVGSAPGEYLRPGSAAEPLIADQAVSVLTDVGLRGLAADPLPGAHGLQAYAGVRVTDSDGEVLGVLHVADTAPREFSASDMAALETAARAITHLLQTELLARQDAETGALTERAFREQLRRMAETARIGNQWISIVTLDLLAHDGITKPPSSLSLTRLLIHRLTEIGRTQIRRRDCLGRLDEGRFAVLLTDTDRDGAIILARRLCKQLWEGWPQDALSASSGVAIHAIKPADAAADEAEALLASGPRGEPAAGASDAKAA